MAHGPKKKRKGPISYRPPAGLEEEFYARVQKSGLSVNAFITKAVFDQDAPRQSPRPPVEAKLLAQLLVLGGRIVDQLREIALSGKGSGNTRLLEEAVGILIEIRAGILTLLRRKP